MFKNSTSGYVTFSIVFEPDIETLISFYNKHKSDIVRDVVEVEIQKMVRDLRNNYNVSNLSVNEFEKLIATKIKSKSGVLSFIRIIELSPVQVRV